MVRKNNGYTGVMMEKKDKKKLVIIFVMILFVGICVDLSKGITDIENVLVRNELGESNRQEQLVVTIEGVQKELEYVVDVEAILPTKEEAEEYFSIAEKEIDNDFQMINTYVPMQECYAKELVWAEWSFSPWNIVNTDGEIRFDEVPEEGIIVNASVELSCGEYEEVYQFPFEVKQKEKTQEEKILTALDEWMESQLQKEGEKEVLLPTEILGNKLTWSRKQESLTIQILILEVLALVVLMLFTKQTKTIQEKKRMQMLEREYPELVGKLAILTGAGVSIRQAWNIIATRYLDKRQKNLVSEKEVFESIVKMNRRIKEGENEKIAYQKFANETQNHLYHRLIRLLIGNLEKGNKGMQEALAQESSQAYEQRIISAKKIGEEASTRMLVPLMLMMLVVMAIVMAPAMLDFMG